MDPNGDPTSQHVLGYQDQQGSPSMSTNVQQMVNVLPGQKIEVLGLKSMQSLGFVHLIS